jgi:hypothetical protein
MKKGFSAAILFKARDMLMSKTWPRHGTKKEGKKKEACWWRFENKPSATIAQNTVIDTYVMLKNTVV